MSLLRNTGERFIAQTIDSVIGQTFQDWRPMIVDDLSTDRTEEIILGYAARDSRIVLIKGEHKGIAAAANIGLRAVTAPLARPSRWRRRSPARAPAGPARFPANSPRCPGRRLGRST